MAASQNITPEYVLELLAILDPGGLSDHGRKAGAAPAPDKFVHSLIKRELRVLGYLAEGKTNQEIASEMVVSINTVKSHLKNIYGKLGVNSRREAVAQARVRSLIVDLD